MNFKFLVWIHRFHRSHGLLSQVVKVVFNLLPTDYVRLSRMSFNHRLHRFLIFLQELVTMFAVENAKEPIGDSPKG